MTLGRLSWLGRHARERDERTAWITVPLALVVLVMVIAPVGDSGENNRRDASGPTLGEVVVAHAGASGLTKVGRADLEVLMASHQNLPGADLRTQDLHDFFLRGKNLAGAQLAVSDLRGADLDGVDLRAASLYGALASDARLRNADLRGANLHCADLTGADLRGAKLSGAGLRGVRADGFTRWPSGFVPSAHGVRAANAEPFYEYVVFDCDGP